MSTLDAHVGIGHPVNAFARKDPGFLVEQEEGGATLVVTGSWSEQAERFLESGRADGLDLN
jgi:hypothetical protein